MSIQHETWENHVLEEKTAHAKTKISGSGAMEERRIWNLILLKKKQRKCRKTAVHCEQISDTERQKNLGKYREFRGLYFMTYNLRK